MRTTVNIQILVTTAALVCKHQLPLGYVDKDTANAYKIHLALQDIYKCPQGIPLGFG